MAQVKLTVRRGANTPAAVTIAAGTPEAQTDTVSLNIDYTKISKGDALLMIEQFRQRLFSLPWPPIAGGGVALTLSGPLTFTTSDAPGTLVGYANGVPTGVTPTLTPNDGRLVFGAISNGVWPIVTGNTAATAGTIALSVSAAGATGAGASVVVSAAVTLKPLLWTTGQRVASQMASNSSDRMLRHRGIHLTGFRASRFRVALVAWGKPGAEQVSPIALELVKAAVEVGGGYAPVKFSGARTKTIDPTVTLNLSDWITPSDVVGATLTEFARDLEIYSRVKLTLPNGCLIPLGPPGKGQGMSTIAYDAANDAGEIDATGVFPTTPAGAVAMNDNLGLSLFIIADPIVAGSKAALVVGDSISYGLADSAFSSSGLSNKAGFGFHDRATIDGNSQSVLALAHSSLSGERMSQWLTRASRVLTLMDYVNIVHDQFGTNDIAAGTTAARTLSEMQADKVQFWSICRARGVQRILTTPILPRVSGDTSSDGTQSYINNRYAPGGQRDLFNSWLATKVGTSDGTDVLVDINAINASATDPNRWAGGSADGTHPSTGGHSRTAPVLRSAWLQVSVDGVANSGPTLTIAPSISAPSVQVGQTATRTQGTYSTTPTARTGSWHRNGAAIPGETAATYVLAAGDVDAMIDYVETATFSSGGPIVATSNAIGPIVAAGAPTNTVAPTITGTAQVGQVATLNPGTWTNTPTGYSYELQRDGVAFGTLTGAGSVTYTYTTDDQGTVFSTRVTATNASGSASRTSAGVGPIAAASAVAPGTVMFNDTFTEASTVGLASHTSDSGHTWARNNAVNAGNIISVDSANGRTIATAVPSQYNVTNLTLTAADYDVEGTLNRRSSLANNCFFVARGSATTNDGYFVQYANGTGVFTLLRINNGTSTVLGTYTQAMANGDDLIVRLTLRGAVLKLLVGGVERISVTDSDPITSAGTIGHRLSSQVVASATGTSLTQLRVLSA